MRIFEEILAEVIAYFDAFFPGGLTISILHKGIAEIRNADGFCHLSFVQAFFPANPI
jgi:hypothetical protein